MKHVQDGLDVEKQSRRRFPIPLKSLGAPSLSFFFLCSFIFFSSFSSSSYLFSSYSTSTLCPPPPVFCSSIFFFILFVIVFKFFLFFFFSLFLSNLPQPNAILETCHSYTRFNGKSL